MKIPVYRVIDEMIRYNGGAPNLIQHALKVYAFAKAIGEEEGLSEETQEILETAAVLHDIGIRESERKYGDADGVHQQLLLQSGHDAALHGPGPLLALPRL